MLPMFLLKDAMRRSLEGTEGERRRRPDPPAGLDTDTIRFAATLSILGGASTLVDILSRS